MERKLGVLERRELIQRHRRERDKRICDRIKAVLAYDEGYGYSEIARLLLLDDETVRRHVEAYHKEGKLSCIVTECSLGFAGCLSSTTFEWLKREWLQDCVMV